MFIMSVSVNIRTKKGKKENKDGIINKNRAKNDKYLCACEYCSPAVRPLEGSNR